MSDCQESIARSPSEPSDPRRPPFSGDSLAPPACCAGLDAAARSRREGYARPLLELCARFEPEHASAIGIPGAAERASQLSPRRVEQRLAAFEDARRTLRRQLTRESLPALRLDLRAMITASRWEIDVVRCEAALMLPYHHPAAICFEGIRSLTSDPGSTDPAPAMRRRLRLYAGLEEGARPLAEQAEAAVRARLGERALLPPCRAAVERDLASGGRLTDGIGRLLEEHRAAGRGEPWRVLRRQLAGYAAFVRREVLPRCRDDFRLPSELYAAKLRACGVEMRQRELASRARVALREIGRQLAAEARRLARQRRWRRDDFPAVLRRLTRERLAGGKLVDHYRVRLRELEKLIAGTGLATLPRRRLGIRLASAAETVALPGPHFRWPRLFGNDLGAMGELILPAFAGGKGQPSADGTSPASSWLVAAHEALPGHALQLGGLLDRGASLGRSIVAWNPASQEGWAVYAESEIEPQLPPEARLVALHRSLRRAAAAFLDPGLQQGSLTLEQARGVLHTQVGLDEQQADREVWRYTLWRPGQATAYFCGYSLLADLRAEMECRLGPAFDRRRYHDFLIAQGVLPLSLLRRRVLEVLGPRQRHAA